MAWGVMSGVTKMAWDVMSGVTKTAWDVLSGVANLCGMFCLGCKKWHGMFCPGMFCPAPNSNCYSLTFKLVLQNHFHGLSSTIERLLSDKCVCLNFVLWLTAIFLTTSAIYKRPLFPPPFFFYIFLYFLIVFSCQLPKKQKTTQN